MMNPAPAACMFCKTWKDITGLLSPSPAKPGEDGPGRVALSLHTLPKNRTPQNWAAIFGTSAYQWRRAATRGLPEGLKQFFMNKTYPPPEMDHPTVPVRSIVGSGCCGRIRSLLSTSGRRFNSFVTCKPPRHEHSMREAFPREYRCSKTTSSPSSRARTSPVFRVLKLLENHKHMQLKEVAGDKTPLVQHPRVMVAYPLQWDLRSSVIGAGDHQTAVPCTHCYRLQGERRRFSSVFEPPEHESMRSFN